MTTQYTPTLKLALPVTGELSGTWGDVVNDNITSMIEQAIAGLATINSWTGNAHTLTTANGTTSESRCAMLVAATGSGGTAITGAGEIICPAAAKLYVLQNNTSYAVTLKTSAGTGVAVAAGDTAFLFCDGTNVNSCVTTIVNGHITGNLTVDGNATVNGNTTLGNATSDTITATARFASDLLPSTDNARDLGSTANSWKDLYIDGTAYLALVDINGGTIDGVSIGASTAATIINVDNLRLDGNTISSTDTNGNVVIAPNGTGDVQLDADTVRVGDSGAAATLTSNGAGALTVTTGGAADLTLSTNSGTTSGTIVIANGAGGNITLTPEGTGDVILAADRVQIGDANTDTTLTTNGTGSLNLTTNNGTNSGTIQIAQGANGNITLTPNGTGSVSVPKLVWSNGTATRVPYLTTGGQFTDSANLTFNGTDLTVSGAVNAGSVNATTLDLTNLEVTNIKAKDGTASMSIADSTGAVTVSAAFAANGGVTLGDASGDALTINSSAVSIPNNLNFDSNTLFIDATNNYVGVNTNTPDYPLNVSGTINVGSSGANLGILLTPTTSSALPSSSTKAIITGLNSGFGYAAGSLYLQPRTGVSAVLAIGTNGVERASFGDSAIVFNEDGVDLDFRVEADTNTHALFVDAGNNAVTMGVSSPQGHLHLYDDTKRVQLDMLVTSAVTNTSGLFTNVAHNAFTQGVYLDGSGYGHGFLSIGYFGDDGRMLEIGTMSSSTTATATFIPHHIFYPSGSVVFNEGGYDADFRVESDTNTHALYMEAGVSRVGINNSSPYQALSVTGSIEAGSSSATAGSVTLYNRYAGDSNDYIALWGTQFSSGGPTMAYGLASSGSTAWNSTYDNFSGTHSVLVLDGSNLRFLSDETSSATTVGSPVTVYERLALSRTEAVFNDDSRDVDFRVESDTNTHALFVDAGNSRVGVNTSGPNAPLHVDGPVDSLAVHISAPLYQNSGTSLSKYLDVKIGNSYLSNYAIGQVKLRAYGNIWNNSASALEMYTQTGSGTDVSNLYMDATESVFNQSSADVDFRVESDTNTHAFFVDAGNNRIGFSDSAPDTAWSLSTTNSSATGNMKFNGVKKAAIQGQKSGSTAVTVRCWFSNYSSAMITFMYAHTNGGDGFSFAQIAVGNAYGTMYNQTVASKLTNDFASPITFTANTPTGSGGNNYVYFTMPAGNASPGYYTITVEGVSAAGGSGFWFETV